MNKSIKIILLVFAILIAVEGIFVFFKTIVAPPAYLTFSNQYVSAFQKDIADLNTIHSIEEANTVCEKMFHIIDFQWKDSLISTNDRDNLLRSFVNDFAPVYTKHCNQEFANAIWDESKFEKMQDHIKYLQSIKETNGTVCISSEGYSSLNRINDVIAKYYKAMTIASNTGFSSISAARDRINSAREYADMSPLSNCRVLSERLHDLPNRLNQSHISYLNSMVERLKHWQNYSEENYDNLAIEISEKLKEYKQNAHRVYGTATDISALEARAGQYYNNSNF